MPKEGFKSITLAATVYDKYYEMYDKQKQQLAFKGVNSFAGYIASMLEERLLKDETFARHAPRIQELIIDEEQIILKDNIKNRIAEVVIQRGELYCQLCESKDCIHIGYVLSIPTVYGMLGKKGIKQKAGKEDISQ